MDDLDPEPRPAVLAPADLVVRAEEPDDAAAVDAVVADAFRGAPYSAPPSSPGGPPGEVDLLRLLRRDEGWLPELALVAEVDGQIVGQVVCTRAHVGEVPVLGLGPVSVLPAHQSQGIGAALIREVVRRAEQSGETLVGLVGDPAYYGRFGFVPAHELGVESPVTEYGDLFQALALAGRPHPRGRFRYTDAFDAF